MSKVQSQSLGLYFKSMRKPLEPFSDSDLAHIRHVGEIVYAWNLTHNLLFRIFAVIGTDFDHELAHRIWHTHGSDNAQRALLGAVIDRAPTFSLEDAMRWALSALEDLSKYRNDAVHLPPMIGFPVVTPDAATKKATEARLEQSPVRKHWRKLCGDLYAISNYLQGVQWALYLAQPRPLSRRPKLLLARTTPHRAQAQRRKAKLQARARQRQASRG